MCRNSPTCVLLGNDPDAWSKTSSLPPPVWFNEQALLFRDSARSAAEGDMPTAIQVSRTIRSDEMRAWFDEHGQVSGRRRTGGLGLLPAPSMPIELDPVRSPAKIEKQVFERDSYRCRYCGTYVIAKEALIAFEKAVGASEFRTKGTNAEQHGVVHAFKAVADHVVPYKRGGRTDLDNLVTSCPGCNYGKEAFTVEQLGISDPRDSSPKQDRWDGLNSLVPGLLLRRIR